MLPSGDSWGWGAGLLILGVALQAHVFIYEAVNLRLVYTLLHVTRLNLKTSRVVLRIRCGVRTSPFIHDSKVPGLEPRSSPEGLCMCCGSEPTPGRLGGLRLVKRLGQASVPHLCENRLTVIPWPVDGEGIRGDELKMR